MHESLSCEQCERLHNRTWMWMLKCVNSMVDVNKVGTETERTGESTWCEHWTTDVNHFWTENRLNAQFEQLILVWLGAECFPCMICVNGVNNNALVWMWPTYLWWGRHPDSKGSIDSSSCRLLSLQQEHHIYISGNGFRGPIHTGRAGANANKWNLLSWMGKQHQRICDKFACSCPVFIGLYLGQQNVQSRVVLNLGMFWMGASSRRILCHAAK